MIRILDFIFAVLGLTILFPVFLIISVLIIFDSKGGGVFYCQKRVGKGGKPFFLYKFRSMKIASDKQGLLTVGDKDNRITKIGYFIRKTKLDELPQLLNILKGEMSMVGPRPEVEKYTSLYNEQQKRALNVLPGITDMASIVFRNENELLANQENAEQFYIRHIMPRKLELNMEYIENPSVFNYMRIIIKTILTIITK